MAKRLAADIPDELFNKFKGLAALQGKKIKDALTEAVAMWVEDVIRSQDE